MNSGPRPIDSAMADDRPAKDVVRQWWVQQVQQRKLEAIALNVRAYLTLPGGDGRDIQALIDAGVIAVTEAGVITDVDTKLLVAYEANTRTAAQVKRTFPNLDVQPRSIEAELGGTALDNYPDSKTKKRLRALVVNLDYNCSWKPDGSGEVSTLATVEKLAKIHGPAPQRQAVNWCLALTLHAQLDGAQAGLTLHLRYLREQAEHHPALKALIEAGAPWIMDPKGTLKALSAVEVQIFLMLLVPTKLANLTEQGWELVADHIAAYGHDVAHRAPMVTFVISLAHDPHVTGSPLAARARFYGSLDASIASIDVDGTVAPAWPLDPVPKPD